MKKSACLKKMMLAAILVAAAFFSTSLNGQNLPTVIPRSPEAASIFKYLDYPVSNATGIPDISIPLYVVKSGSLSLPVSISYHSSGRKVADQTGAVGIGWTLNAGGMISRTVYGKPDDKTGFPSSPKQAANLNSSSYDDLNYLNDLVNPNGNTDQEYDIFSYNFGKNYGKFVVDQNNSRVLLMPLKPLKVDYSSFPSQIIDELGITYDFGEVEQTYSPNQVTGKFLTQITSADKRDIISFTYTTVPVSTGYYIENIIVQDNDYTDFGGSYYYNTTGRVSADNSQIYYSKRISTIHFKDGWIQFNLKAGNGGSTTDQIDNITVYNNSNQVIRVIKLGMSTMDSPSYAGSAQKLKLDNLQIWDNAKAIENYKFDYQPSTVTDGRKRDFWGYFNSSSSVNLVPNTGAITLAGGNGTVGTSVTYNNADRSVSAALPSPAASCIIKRITYPTGGFTEFTFEPNEYRYGNDTFNQTGPGLRVKEIKTTDNNGTIRIKTYTYGASENGAGVFNSAYLAANPIPYMATEKRYTVLNNYNPGATTSYRVRTYTSEILSDIAEVVGAPVEYNQVTEYNGTVTSNMGKSVYQYESSEFVGTNHVISSFQNVAFATSYGNTGQYNTSNWQVDGNLNRKYISEYNFWKTPDVRQITIYKNDGSNNYTAVKNIVNNYTYTYTNTDAVVGLHVIKYNDVNDQQTAAYINMPVFQYADYTIKSGKKELTSTSETNLSGSTYTTTTTNYAYNSNLLTSQTSTTKSNGDVLTTYLKYPFDETSAVNTDLVSNHMIGLVTEQADFIGATPLKAVKTTYRNWGTTDKVLYPEFVYTKKGTDNYEPRVQYNYDADGHLRTVSKTNGPPVSYIFGYNKQYAIAQATNAPFNDIFYTGFEETDGNSTTDDAHTGHKSRIGGYSTALTGLDAGTYTLSYWQKAGGVWNLQSAAVTVGGSSYTISIPGSYPVDDVCFYPVNAQLITYTYDPLFGMTSSIDAKGQTLYYEYDNYQRLSTIKDHMGNIKVHYCYNYAGQTTDCSVTAQVWAKLVPQNTTSSNVGGYTHTYATYQAQLYTDAACTQPYTATIDLPVAYIVASTTTYQGSSSTANYVYSVTVPSGSSTALTGAIDISGCVSGNTLNSASQTQSAKGAQTSQAKTGGNGGTNAVEPGDGASCTTSTVTITTATGYIPVY